MNQPEADPSSEPQSSSRRRQWGIVLSVALALLVLRFVAGWPFSSPWYEPDESTYALRAYHLAQGDGLSWRHPNRPAGAPGAPILMSLTWLLAGDDTDLFVQLTYIVNSLLACGIVIVGYAAFRRWFDHWAALLGAVAMAIYGPIFIYGYTFLGEPLFFFLFVVTVWAAQRVADTGRWPWWLALGLATAASQVARVTGFAFVAAAVFVGIVHLVHYRNRAAVGHLACLLAGIAVLLGPIALLNRPRLESAPDVGIEVGAGTLSGQPSGEATAAGSAASAEATPATPARAAGSAISKEKEQLYSYSPTRREYTNLIRHLLSDTTAKKNFSMVVLWALNYILLAGMVLPVVLAVRFALIRRWFRPAAGRDLRRTVDPGVLYMMLACLFTFGGIVLRLGLSESATIESMYGRYLDVIVMICVGLGSAYLADGLILRESLLSLGRTPSAREVRRARKRGAPEQRGEASACVTLFVVAFIVTVIAVVTLPKNIKIIFSANLGTNYAAQIGGQLSQAINDWMLGYGKEVMFRPGHGAELIAIILTPLLAILCWLAWRQPRAAGVGLILLLTTSSAIAYHQSMVFMARNRAQDFHEFARQATAVLEKHFRENPQLERVVVVDKPPLTSAMTKEERERATVLNHNSRWSLEFYNRDIQFVRLWRDTKVYPETPVFSMRPRALPVLLRHVKERGVDARGRIILSHLGIYRGTKLKVEDAEETPDIPTDSRSSIQFNLVRRVREAPRAGGVG